MLYYLRTDLFTSPAQTLVNTVNTEGVMGKGIAKTFKERFPEMYREYRAVSESGQLTIGTLMLWRGLEKWVLNFPTKTTWRQPSRLEYLEAGLEKFLDTYTDLAITSVSFPPLGCGNGTLDWSEVKPLMEKYLKRARIPVYVHDRHVPADFVPEHLEGVSLTRPGTAEKFLSDIRLATQSRQCFRTLSDSGTFGATTSAEGDLDIITVRKRDRIPAEEIEIAWSTLQSGLLTADQYGSERARRYKSYLFAILATLPYVVCAEIQQVRDGNPMTGHALYFKPDTGGAITRLERPVPHQQQLSLWG